MRTIVITPDNEKDFVFLSVLPEKLGYKIKIVDNENKEDMGLLIAMFEEKKIEHFSEDEVMQALGRK